MIKIDMTTMRQKDDMACVPTDHTTILFGEMQYAKNNQGVLLHLVAFCSIQASIHIGYSDHHPLSSKHINIYL